jgi:aspartyl aminopeptidase
VLSPRLDNLASSYGALKGFVGSDPHGSVSVCAIFDNEEIGSQTRTGACGDLLECCLRRLCAQKGVEYDVLKARSLFVSADACHAQHPNHPGHGEVNHPLPLGSGVALKEAYKGSWAFDAAALAIVIEAAKRAGAEYSLSCLKNGRRGGGTIGPKVEAMLGIRTIDVGHVQLAMHSYRETMAWKDIGSLVKFCQYLYGHYEELRELLNPDPQGQ